MKWYAIGFFALTACGTVESSSYSPLQDRSYRNREEIQSSLFSSDEKAISNEAIDQILSGKISIQSSNNIAVLSFSDSHSTYSGNNAQCLSQIQKELKNNSRVTQLTFIPQLLLPNKVNVSALREAAARLQSELVLIYQVKMEVHEDANLFSKDEARSYASVEAMLLHVRTGIVPWTFTADQEFRFKENNQDEQNRGLYFRARDEATKKALSEVGSNLNGFLNQLSTE